MKQLCVIKINDKYYILDLLLKKHDKKEYASKEEAQKAINKQIKLCKLMCE